jgi:hypothetical protein
MSIALPEWELGTCLKTRRAEASFMPWDEYREKLASLNSSCGPDTRLLECTQLVKNSQRQRRTWQDEKPRFLAQEDPITLQIGVRQIKGYRDKMAIELTRLRSMGVPHKILEILEEEVSYSDDYALYIEDALRLKVGVPGVSEAERQAEAIFNSRAIKSEIAMVLKQKYEDLKKRTAPEFHSQIDRDFRQAVQELDKR